MQLPFIKPSDADVLMEFYIQQYPQVIEPRHIIDHGFWIGIAGRSQSGEVTAAKTYEQLRMDLQAYEGWVDGLFGGDAPDVRYMDRMPDGSFLERDSSFRAPAAPPPARYVSPDATHGNDLVQNLMGR